jgi:hypothetical protein
MHKTHGGGKADKTSAPPAWDTSDQNSGSLSASAESMFGLKQFPVKRRKIPVRRKKFPVRQK